MENLNQSYPSHIEMTKSEVMHNLWKRFTYGKNIINGITLITFVYWIVLMYNLYHVLIEKDTQVTFSYKNRLGFSSYFFIIALYPIIYLGNQLYQTNTKIVSEQIDPFYALCVEGPDQLSKQELAVGAVGKLDYRCLKETYEYNMQYGEMITNRTWYIIHSIFALVLFLFAESAGKYKNSVVSSQSHFMTRIIQQALFLSIILMGVDMFTEFYYLSTLSQYFFTNILQLTGALTVMLVSFILYRLIYIFV